MATTEALPEKRKSSWRAWRRRRVKRLGRRVLALLAVLYGRQSRVPDLPFIPTEHFPFIAEVEAHWKDILAELEVLLEDRERIPFLDQLSPDQARISHSQKWRAFFLWGLGEEATGNTARCPKTAALLRKIPGLRSSWFSILAPNYHIKPHTGITKGIARAHLGLIIPKNWQSCSMTVGDETNYWREGKCFIFDDSMRHSVLNDTDEERVVLLFDFDRPMRWPSSTLHLLAMSLLKRTAYYKDARSNILKYQSAQMTEAEHDRAIADAMQSIED
jgi:aspartyl/asparaginyl beta-hydroxylase (cupin superfamily)